MGTARTSSKPIRRTLVESCAAGKGAVDRENRVIKGVKILGKSSPNCHGMEGIAGTEYSDAAMERAIPLYEGRQSYADHPSRQNPGVERATRDLVGVHRNVRRQSDGLYSDFHYRSSHAYLADDAEQMPDALGFSHNATGAGSVRNGKYLVDSIDKVRSIDLVTRPATTRGLYESEETPMATKTLKEALASLKLDAKVMAQLLEMDGMDGNEALQAPAPDGPSYKDHLGEAIKAIMADDSLDLAAMKSKINAILKAANDESPAEKAADAPDKKAADPNPAHFESLQSELTALKTTLSIRDLCESKNFKPSKIQLKSLTLLEEDERVEFVTEAAKAAAPAPGTRPAPRSQSSRNFQESVPETKDAKSFAAYLLN